MPPSRIRVRCAEEIEAVFLIRPQLGVQVLRQVNGRDTLEFGNALAQRLRLGGVGRTAANRLRPDVRRVPCRPLGHGDEAFHAHFGHRLVRALNGGRVEFHPAGIRQFDKAAGRGGEPFQIRLGKFQPSCLPLGGNRQPVNAAALDDEARLERARREEQPVKRRVAEKFRVRWASPPRHRQASRENFRSRRRSTSPAPA